YHVAGATVAASALWDDASVRVGGVAVASRRDPLGGAAGQCAGRTGYLAGAGTRSVARVHPDGAGNLTLCSSGRPPDVSIEREMGGAQSHGGEPVGRWLCQAARYRIIALSSRKAGRPALSSFGGRSRSMCGVKGSTTSLSKELGMHE